MKVKLLIEVDMDDKLWNFIDKEEKEWFNEYVLDGDLILHSNEIGDELGMVDILEKDKKLGGKL